MLIHPTLFNVGNPWLITLVCTALIIHWSFERNYDVLVNNSFRISFEGRQLCVLVLHSTGPDSYLTLLSLVPWHLETGVICSCTTFCWTRQLFSTTLICPVAFVGRVFCVLVLHSTGPDSYLILL